MRGTYLPRRLLLFLLPYHAAPLYCLYRYVLVVVRHFYSIQVPLTPSLVLLTGSYFKGHVLSTINWYAIHTLTHIYMHALFSMIDILQFLHLPLRTCFIIHTIDCRYLLSCTCLNKWRIPGLGSFLCGECLGGSHIYMWWKRTCTHHSCWSPENPRSACKYTYSCSKTHWSIWPRR